MITVRLLMDGTAERLGVDQPAAEVVLLTSTRLVLKVPGRKYYASRGHWKYAPVEYQAFEVKGFVGRAVQCVELVSFDLAGLMRTPAELDAQLTAATSMFARRAAEVSP